MATVRKRRGRWVLDFYDHKGKRRWKTMPAGTTKKAAKDYLRGVEDQVAKRTYLSDKRIPTLKEVAQGWIEHKKPNLRQSTWSVYEGHTRNHFKDLESLKINRITTAKVEKFIDERLTECMNLSTLRKILVSLGQIMAYAVRHGYIDHNPLRDAERPRGQGEHGDEDQKIRVLTPPEITRLLDSVKDRKYRVMFMLAITSGTRQGEILGLKWSDVDWDNNQIHIQRTFNNGRWYEVKTKRSNRRIDIGPSTMSALRRWKLACPPNQLNLVFPNEAGNPIDHHNLVNRHFNPALKEANLPKIRFHDLRHTYASLLIEQGENVKYIQSQLGHSSPTVTLNVYAHLMKPTNQEAALRLDKTIFENDGSKMVATNKKGVTVVPVTP